MNEFEYRSCIGKIKHKTLVAALTHRKKLCDARGMDESLLSAYRCRYCGYYHVGHRRLRASA